MSEAKQQVSRRQFLNYTLSWLGGVMAVGMLVPMLRLAVDQVLQPSSACDFANVCLAIDDITTEPQRIDWKIARVDGWYESEVSKSACVFKNDDNEILAF